MEVEDAWIKYSDMDTSRYTGLLTAFSSVTSLFTHPLNVVTTVQQASLMTGDKKAASEGIMSSMLSYKREMGFLGLFRGWTVITLMGMPSQVIYLHVTEVSREYLQRTLHSLFPGTHVSAVDLVQTGISSVLANLTSNIPYVPAEVISNRMIVDGRSGLSTLAMTKKIFHEDGIRGFYRGFGASLAHGTLFSAQWWFWYSSYRRSACKLPFFKEQPMALDATSGLVAGQLTTATLHPLDTIKTLIMTEHKEQNGTIVRVGIWQRARDIVRTNGLRALWRGLGASMYHSAFSCTGFAIIYEVIKRFSIDEALSDSKCKSSD